MRYGRLGLVVVLAVLTGACGAAGLAQLATILSGVGDPAADTAPAAPPTVYDITQLVTRRLDNSPFGSYDTLQVEATFAQPVVLPPPGGTGDAAGTQMVPEVQIDVDQDPTTGGGYGCGSLGFSMPGGEFQVLSWEGAGRLANGNYAVHQGFGPVTGEATVTVSGNVLTFNIPLSALGNDDGATRVGLFVGNRNAGASVEETDCAPNGGGMVITRNGRPVRGNQR